MHVQSFPRACCDLKPIWRSQKLYLGTTMIKQRSKQLFFRLHSTIPRTNTEPRRAVLHTKVHSMVFTYLPTDTVSTQAVTVAETCINICHASYSKCSSQYSYASRESRRQRSRAVRVLKLYSRGPEFNPLPNRLQDLSLLVPSSNPNTVTLVNSQLSCSRKFGILNLACLNVNRWFTANGIAPVNPAASSLVVLLLFF